MSDKITLRDSAVSWTPTDDGQIVVLDMRTSRYLSLNASGAALWRQLADGGSQAELVTGLIERFGLSEETAATDVAAFLQALRERDLIVG